MEKFSLCAFADEADTSLDGQIKALSENHIHNIELRGVNEKKVAVLTTDEALMVRKKLDIAWINVWSIGSPAGKTDINADFSRERESFSKLLETARITGAKCIRLFSFYGTGGESRYSDEVVHRLRVFCDMAHDAGIIPCHENEKGIYGDNAQRCRELLDAVPGLSAVFDPANFVQCGQDIKAAWEMLCDRVLYCHIKDATADGKIVPAGHGIGCIEYILNKFHKKGGCILTLEPHLSVFSGLSELEEEKNKSDIGTYVYKDNRSAFDCAVAELCKIIGRIE